MKLENTFAVDAPIDQVWAVLMDVQRVTGCVPGAAVLGQLSEDAYQVGMKVRLGPVSMQYRGQVEVLERDESAHRAVLRGRAKEARGQGTADATVQLRLAEADGGTRGTVEADVRLSGRAAAMGQGVIGDVADAMVGQFAGNLQTLLAGGDDATAGTGAVAARSGATVAEAVDTAAGPSHGGVLRDVRPGGAPVEEVGGDPAMTAGQVVQGPGSAGTGHPAPTEGPQPEAAVSGGAQSLPGARVSDRVAAGPDRPPAPAAGSEGPSVPAAGPDRPRAPAADRLDEGDAGGLDGLALARAVVLGRLRDPGVLAGVLLAVAVLAFRLGRRSRGPGRARGSETAYHLDDLERLAALLDRLRTP